MVVPYKASEDDIYKAGDQLERVLKPCLRGTHIEDIRRAVQAIYNEIAHHVAYGYKDLPEDTIASKVLGKLGIPESTELGQTVRHQLLEFFRLKAA